MLLGVLEKDNQFILEAANAVNLVAGSTSSSGGFYLVNIPTGDTKFAFGVVLGELIENQVMHRTKTYLDHRLPAERRYTYRRRRKGSDNQ